MEPLRVCLFGQFRVQWCGEMATSAFSPRLQELFCYLLLFRDEAHPRETVAGVLWPDSTTAHSRRNLRQALWQLRNPRALGGAMRECDMLLVDPEWLQLNPAANLWLDVKVFEDALLRTEGVPGQMLDKLQAEALDTAVALYRGDLLQGCYQDWCLYERARLEKAYLHTLEKLMDYCATCGEYRSGLAYGEQALRHDGARERIHRRLMRLHYLVGERGAAMRQYDRCVEVLRRELGVKPVARTVALYQRMRAGQSIGIPPSPGKSTPAPGSAPTDWPKMVKDLTQLQATVDELQQQIREALHTARENAGNQL